MEASTDLTLKGLEQHTGTSQYHRVLTFNVTDGVKYVMENGYAWLVTDALAVLMFRHKFPKLRNQPFLTVELRRIEGTKEADLVMTDGNNNTLYKQHYGYTDAKRDLKLYFENNVLCLPSER